MVHPTFPLLPPPPPPPPPPHTHTPLHCIGKPGTPRAPSRSLNITCCLHLSTLHMLIPPELFPSDSKLTPSTSPRLLETFPKPLVHSSGTMPGSWSHGCSKGPPSSQIPILIPQRKHGAGTSYLTHGPSFLRWGGHQTVLASPPMGPPQLERGGTVWRIRNFCAWDQLCRPGVKESALRPSSTRCQLLYLGQAT